MPAQVPLQPAKVAFPEADAVSDADVPGRYNTEQLPPEFEQLMPPSLLLTEPFPVPAIATLSLTPSTKLAVIVLSPSIVTEQGPLPEQAPPQLWKREPESAAWLRSTTVPLEYVAEQLVPQLIGPLSPIVASTDPEPLPNLVTVSVKTGNTVLVCMAALFAGARSGSVAVALIELVIVPGVVGVTTIVI